MLRRIAAALVLAVLVGIGASCSDPVTRAVAPARPATTTSAPAQPTAASALAIDLRPIMTPVKAQGDRDACAFFAVAAVVEAEMKAKLGRDVDLSEEFMVQASKADGRAADRETATVADVYSTVMKRGFLLEQDWAYQPTWFSSEFPECGFDWTDPKAPAKCYAHNPPSELALSRKLATRATGGKAITPGSLSKEVALTRIRASLAARVPLVFTFPHPADNTGWPPSGDLAWNDVLAEKHGFEGPVHFAVLTGHDPAKKLFTFKNSWGASWGHDGYGTVSEAMLLEYSVALFAFQTEVVPFAPRPSTSPLVSGLSVKAKRDRTDAIVVEVEGSVDDIEGRFISVRAEIVSQRRSSADPSFADVAEVELTDTERKLLHARTPRGVWNHVSSDVTALRWTRAAPLRIQIPKAVLTTPTVTAVLSSKVDRPVIRATVYTFTDDVGFKPLSRAFVPLQR